MKFKRSKTVRACSPFAAILFGTLLTGWTWADKTSDFEKMLQEAIQNNRASSSSTEKAAPKSIPAPKRQQGSLVVPRSVVPEPVKPAEPVEPQTGSSFKMNSRSQRPAPKAIDSGWTTVVPNEQSEKSTVSPEPFSVDVIGKKSDASPVAPRDGDVFSVVVADKSMSVAAEAKSKTDSTDTEVSLWDAVPVKVVPKEEEEEKEETTEEKREPAKDTQEKAPVVFPADESSDETKEGSEDKEDSGEKQESAPKGPTKISEENPAKDDKDDKAADSKQDPKDEIKASEDDMASKLKEMEQKNREAQSGKESGDSEKEETVEPRKIVIRPDSITIEGGEDKEKGTSQDKAAESESKEPIIQALPEPSCPDFDSDDDVDAARPALVDGSRVGDPHGKNKVKLMIDEIVNGLKTRNVTGRYEMWKNYARNTLRSTSGMNTGSEVDGRCRLSWYTKLYSEPVQSVSAVEEFSRQLHHGLSRGHRHLAETMAMIREKLDVAARNDEGIRFHRCETPYDALNEVKRCLLEAQMAHGRALSTLSTVDQNELANNLVSTFSGQGCVNGHTIPNRTYGRKLVNIMNKIDKTGMHEAAEALIPLTNLSLLALLDELPEDAFATIMLNGQKVQRLATSAGDIIIGGRENNVYDLDSPEMRDVVCVIDLGGNDTYREGTCNLLRPVLVVIDLRGDDTYTGSKPGIQGGSVLGISMLVDMEGNDTYTAGDIAQGSSIGGVGMLFDFSGHDKYKALRRAQGHALCGVGILVDREGNDQYHAALWAQGFGAPGGFGVLNDVKGNDRYYCGGLYIDSYPEHPGYDGWGQGVGAGIRQVANGGIGAILDGEGDDSYEVDYFGHGGGYWLGIGFARDFGGNDIRHGTTLLGYNGGPRRERQWTRFANGFGCHYACGYLIDDSGNDVYGGTIMGTGMAWDLAFGFLGDFGGNDRFTATGGMTQGVGAEGSIGVLFSYGGDDMFNGRNQAFASGGITYHSPSNCGANFSFLINYGGKDTYGCGAKNNSYVQRGTQTGFLIDRPTEVEAAGELVALQKLVEEREKEIEEFNAQQEKLKAEAAERGRRYYPPRRRPIPISADQQKRIGSVPHFDSPTARTGSGEVKVK